MADQLPVKLFGHVDKALAEHGYGFDNARHCDPANLYILSLTSRESRNTMRRVLNQIALMSDYPGIAAVPWTDITRQGVFNLLGSLSAKGRSPATRNLYLSALKGVCREAFLAKQMTADEYQMIRQVKSVKSRALPRGRALEASEISRLMDHCLTVEGPAGVRDAALLAIFFGCGPRRAEIVKIDTGHIDAAEGTIVVIGKGDKHRELIMPGRTAEILEQWMAKRGAWEGPLFVGINRWRHIGARRLSDRAAYAIVNRRVAQAGMQKASPHDLRRSFITYLLDCDVDIGTVADMAGHADVNTTRIYDRRQKKRNKKAAEKIKF